MKKQITFISLIIVMGAVIAFFVFNNGNENSKNNNTISVQAESLNISKPGILFSQYDSQDQRLVYLKYYSLADGKETIIYSFRVNAEQSSPLFSRYRNDSVFITRAGDEFRDIVVTIEGRLIDNFFSPGYFPYRFSPNEEKLAYSKSVGTADELRYRLVIRNMRDGDEKNIDGGVDSDNQPLILRPIKWTEDNKYVFAISQTFSEGCPVGLHKIDTETMVDNKDLLVDREGLIQISLDDLLRAYGIKSSDYDLFGGKKPSEIYSVDTNNGSLKKHPLLQSRVSQLFEVSNDGKYIAYTYSGNDQLNDLYVYKLTEDREQQITVGSVISDRPYWHEDIVAFIENKQAGGAGNNTRKDLQLYNATTSQLTSISEDIDSLIGWYE